MQGGSSQLIIILIVFGFSALSWIIGQLRQQAAIKKTRDEMRKAREEELRTGRQGGTEPAQPRSSELAELRELAMKRQQQLQQMRDARQRATQGMQVRMPAPDLRNRPPQFPFPNQPRVPTGPGIPVPTAHTKPSRPGTPGTPGTPGLPNPARRPGPTGRIEEIRPPTPTGRPQRRAKAQPQSEESPVPAYTAERAPTRRLVADSDDPTNSANAFADRGKRNAAPIGFAALLGTQGQKPTPAEMRRAIILSEILSPPVATRGTAQA